MTPPIDGPQQGLNAAVAAQLRAERAALGWTIDELAQRADIPAISVRRYLKGERQIDVSVLYALASALGLTAGQVVEAAQERLDREMSEPLPRVALTSEEQAGAPEEGD